MHFTSTVGTVASKPRFGYSPLPTGAYYDVPTLAQTWARNVTQVGLLDAAANTGKYIAGILLQNPRAFDGMSVHAVSG